MERIEDKKLIDIFIKFCERRGMSPHTIESYSSSLNLFSDYLSKNDCSLIDIDSDICEGYIDYLKEKNMSYSTLKNRLYSYNTFYTYLEYKKIIDKNIVTGVCKIYLPRYKDNGGQKRKLISVKDMAYFIRIIPDIRDKAIVLVFAKTGIRRRELMRIDLDDIDWEIMSITLKPTPKRSNLVVYFDYETARILKRWLRKRAMIADESNKALFVSYTNRKKRLNRNGIAYIFVKWATVAGLHNPDSDKLSDKFTPHCCRHWFTTHLRNGGEGMPREYVMHLRGDAHSASMDRYNHIFEEKVQKSYLANVPQLGIF